MKKKKATLGLEDRIGIVNRGEAAVRFLRGLKEYNELFQTQLKSVAFYLDHEQNMPFVQEADYAWPLSRLTAFSTTTTSTPYLNKELMIAALKHMQCKAVWVGWGFLSEDSTFVAMLEEEGFAFLGPSSTSMALLGDKISAKALAEETGVPILPWSKRSLLDLDDAREMAEKIGYPVIIKAAHAGGGRGIRFVRKPEELERQYISARDETRRITGDEVLFMEYFVEKGRHLEVQVAADRHGTIQTFGVRDCSLQRRNQKIVEETPPPHLPPSTIEGLEKVASLLVAAAHYDSVGTVEFLYDVATEKYYFMEVNTRLQVEHPITESVASIDLVKVQIQIAMGQKLYLEKNLRGAAIEVRLNAEDPEKNFIPSPGKVLVYQPAAGPGIRVDSGYKESSVIPKEFDSMIAKIISYGAHREEAMARLLRALRETRIIVEGGTTNQAFLVELLSSKPVREGAVHTRYVEAFLSQESTLIRRNKWVIAIMACAIEQYLTNARRDLLNFREESSVGGYPRNLPKGEGNSATIHHAGVDYVFLVKNVAQNLFHLERNGKKIVVGYSQNGKASLLTHNDNRYEIYLTKLGDVLRCEIDGISYNLALESYGVVRSPSPALVTSLAVEVGQSVEKGQILLSLEAMKMEILVSAQQSGFIKSIEVRKGEQVAAGQTLVVMDTKAQEATAPKPVGDEISFDALSIQEESDLWKAMERELLALFLGYDHTEDDRLFLRMRDFARSHNQFAPLLGATCLQALEIYAALENLFSREKITVEGFAQPLSYQEILFHFFRREKEAEKGLPQNLVRQIQRVFAWYFPQTTNYDEARTQALFLMYKSHASCKEKQKLALSILFAMEEGIYPREECSRKLVDILDEIASLSQKDMPSLRDAAIHARFYFFDAPVIEQELREKRSRMSYLLNSLLPQDLPMIREIILNEVMDASSPYMVADIVRLLLQKVQNEELAMTIMGRYFNRDRYFVDGKLLPVDGISLYRAQAKDHDQTYEFIVGILEKIESISSIAAYIRENLADKKPEVLLMLVSENQPAEEKAIEEILKKNQAPVQWWCCGFIAENGTTTYHTWNSDGETDFRRAFFSPLLFREWRIARLANFNMQKVYETELVCVVHSSAKNNPKDERLFAFVEVPESKPEWREDGSIRRVITLEHTFMEAAQALRAQQAKLRFRLFWNRIVIHMHSFLRTNWKDIQEYVNRLALRTDGLGLERVAVYVRRQEGENTEQEELVFQNVSGERFSLKRRKPSDELLEPMDKYVACVVRSLQLGVNYPYETIRLLTEGGPLSNAKFPRGNFEEFDIEKQGLSSKPISAANRKYGKNQSTVVFGILTNYSPLHPYPLQRVIILNDATTDMGSLAEEECRRIIAALDLAQERHIPVEWVPISAGARIDMVSGTENLDWTARALQRIIAFTQAGGEINIIVAGINVGAQSYWNSEATMLMHTRGLLIMTEDACMLLTGKKALDFSGSISAEDNIGIGGVENIMGPNGEAQVHCKNLTDAYTTLFHHYDYFYAPRGHVFPERRLTQDPIDRDICVFPYMYYEKEGFHKIGDIFSKEFNPERKKPFDIRQVMQAVIDQDLGFFERWQRMEEAETAVVWETRVGGYSVGLLGIESKPLPRIGTIPHNGPQFWNAGTLFPQSSKKIARALNAFSKRLPVVVLANLSGFDGSPESLRKCQLEWGAEIGRAIVNFQGPILFVVIGRYHGGAYVVFSGALNPMIHTAALEGTYASVIGGAPAAAVVFPKLVLQETYNDPRIVEIQNRLKSDRTFTQKQFDEVFSVVQNEKQSEFARRFDEIHSVQRAKDVGSIHDIITAQQLRPYLVEQIEKGMEKYRKSLDR